MIPLYAFLKGDALGLVVFGNENETVEALAMKVQRAATVRVIPAKRADVYLNGTRLDPLLTLAELLSPLDRIDVVPVTEPQWPSSG